MGEKIENVENKLKAQYFTIFILNFYYHTLWLYRNIIQIRRYSRKFGNVKVMKVEVFQ